MNTLVAYRYDTDSKLFAPVDLEATGSLAALADGVDAVITPAKMTPQGITDEPFNGSSWIYHGVGADGTITDGPVLLKTAMPQSTEQLSAIPHMVADQILGPGGPGH